MPGWTENRCVARTTKRVLRLTGALCACAALQLSALEPNALPLPYPARYPAENYTPPKLDLRNVAGIGSRDLSALPEPVPTPRGIQFSKLLLHPFASVDSTFTDNSTRSQLDRKDDELVEYATGLSAFFKPKECVTATLNYEFGWHDYMRDTTRDYLSHQAETEIRIERLGLEGLSLSFTNAYLQTSNSSALENEIAQFSRYHSNRAQIRPQYKFNRFTISGAYAYSFTDYFSFADSISDYDSHAGTLEGAWRVPGMRLEVFENFQYQRLLFHENPDSDYDTLTALSGVRGKYSRLTFSVAAGYTRAIPLRDPLTNGGPAFNASLGYAPHSRISVDVNASRAFQAGVRTGSAVVTDLKAQLQLLLTRRGTLTLSYARSFSDRLDNTTQLSVAYTTRFEYKLARNATLNTGITHVERTNTFSVQNFTINEVRAGFKLVW